MKKGNSINRSVLFMFSGQGTQYYHMAEELYRQHPSFQTRMDQLELVASKYTRGSVLGHLYDGDKNKSDMFADILFSNLSIFFVEYALARTLIEEGIQPCMVVGTSMGEFAAAAVAGVISYEAVIEIIVKKSALMGNYICEGGMLAILENVELFAKTPELNENSELASVNFNQHFVVSGGRVGLEVVKAFLSKKQIVFQSLTASGAYHSSLMDNAAIEFKSFLQNFSFHLPEIKYYSCATGKSLKAFPQNHLWDALRKPILFQNTIEKIEENGPYAYLDLGPSGTLSTFVKYILSKEGASKAYALLSPFGRDMKNYEKVKSGITRA
jgi:acyl transferase domain-containing protein